MAELLQQLRDPNVPQIPQSIGSNDATLQKVHRDGSIHSTPASNLKISEQMRNAPHDSSPTISKMTSSKSFTAGLNRSGSNGSISGSKTSLSSLSSLTDISPSNSQFFEVLYVGKIKVSHKRVPYTFIDDALPKFRAYDEQKLKLQLEAARRAANARAETSELGKIHEGDEKENEDEPVPPAVRVRRLSKESLTMPVRPQE
jgi:TBC1 domain-containing protein 4